MDIKKILKDVLRMEFIVYYNEMIQDGALTSFALYEQFRAKLVHE